MKEAVHGDAEERTEVMMVRVAARWLGVVLAGILAGCCNYTSYDDIIGGIVPHIEAGHTVYVTMPDDGGSYLRYRGSGAQVARFMDEGLRPYCPQVHLGAGGQSLSDALTAAQAVGARYLLAPEILEWTPPATAYSHNPLRLLLTVSVYDMQHNTLVLQRDITVVSRGLTLVSRPVGALARESIREFCRGLFAPGTTSGTGSDA